MVCRLSNTVSRGILAFLYFILYLFQKLIEKLEKSGKSLSAEEKNVIMKVL